MARYFAWAAAAEHISTLTFYRRPTDASRPVYFEMPTPLARRRGARRGAGRAREPIYDEAAAGQVAAGQPAPARQGLPAPDWRAACSR